MKEFLIKSTISEVKKIPLTEDVKLVTEKGDILILPTDETDGLKIGATIFIRIKA